MGLLTIEQVNGAAISLSARATAAIDTLEETKSFMGSVFGNNDTIASTQGDLRMIRDSQIPPWREHGLAIASNEEDDKISSWKNVGQEFAKAIGEIDGYGEDATLASVVAATTDKTAVDVAKASAGALAIIPTKAWITIGVVGLLTLIFVLAPYRKVA